MCKWILSIVLTLLFTLTAFASEIAIPVQFQLRGIAKKNQITELGCYRDEEKFIFAFRIEKLSELIAARGLMSIYWNTDGNVDTGRFPGVSGFDLQFNIELAGKKVKALIWEADKTRPLPLTFYDDDYLLEYRDNLCFLAIRRAALERFRFTDRNVLRMMISQPAEDASTKLERRIDWSGKLNVPEIKFDFIRFRSSREFRSKLRVAEEVSRKDDLRVWNNFGERFSLEESIPETMEKVESMHIKAAKGESESLFFTVSAAKPFKTLKLEASPFKTKNGLSAIPSDHLKIQYTAFVVNDKNERFTDVLSDEYLPAKTSNHFAVLTVTTPRDAAPGIYHGEISVTADGNSYQTIPVEFEVYNFTLPEKTALKTAYSIKNGHISAKFPNPDTVRKLYNQLLDQAHRFRYSPRLLGASPELSLDDDDNLRVNWRKFDAAAERYFGKNSFTIYQEPLAQLGSHDKFYRWNEVIGRDLAAPDDTFDRVWKQYLIELDRHHRQNNLWEQTLFVVWDEPYTAWNSIARAARTVRETLPEVPIGIFIDHYEPKIAEWIDIYLAQPDLLGYFRHTPEHRGKRVWLYNTGNMENFKCPASDLRGYYWLAYKYQVEGLLSSEINQLIHTEMRDGEFYNSYPMHAWMYVDPSGEKLYDSQRQLLVRDGLDDYDYLVLYQALLKARNQTMPEAITTEFPELKSTGEIIFPVASNRDLGLLRDRIAGEIVRLKNEP